MRGWWCIDLSSLCPIESFLRKRGQWVIGRRALGRVYGSWCPDISTAVFVPLGTAALFGCSEDYAILHSPAFLPLGTLKLLHHVPVYDSTSLPMDPLFFPPAWQTGQERVVPPAIMTSALLFRTPTGMDEPLWDLRLLLGRFVFVCLLRLVISSQSLW